LRRPRKRACKVNHIREVRRKEEDIREISRKGLR